MKGEISMLKFGFFDSINGDRKYNSRDVSGMFDGIIMDGIYAQIGQHFSVNPKTPIESTEDKMRITVGTGQGWLNHVKVLNTTAMEIDISPVVTGTRYDALIIEINEETRGGDIYIKEGVTLTGNNLKEGTLVNTEFIHQHLLAIITVKAGSDKLTNADIASKIGFDEPNGIPYVTSPLRTFPADETLKQWVAQWDAFYNKSNSDFTQAQEERENEFDTFMTGADQKIDDRVDQRLEEIVDAKMDPLYSANETRFNELYENTNNSFDTLYTTEETKLEELYNQKNSQLTGLYTDEKTNLDTLHDDNVTRFDTLYNDLSGAAKEIVDEVLKQMPTVPLELALSDENGNEIMGVVDNDGVSEEKPVNGLIYAIVRTGEETGGATNGDTN